MSSIDIQLIALAASISYLEVCLFSAQKHAIHWKQACLIAGVFSFFQMTITYISWAATDYISHHVLFFDKLLAFLLLLTLGCKLIWNSYRKSKKIGFNPQKISSLLTMALATSSNTLIIGVVLVCMNHHTLQSILSPIAALGLMTLGLSVFGIWYGNRDIKMRDWPVERGSGLIFILISIRILSDS